MQEVAATVGGDIRISDATNDVETLINAADALDQVTGQDMGTTVGVFIENEDTGAQDIIIYDDPLLLLCAKKMTEKGRRMGRHFSFWAALWRLNVPDE